MNLLYVLIYISSISFLAYGISYFLTSRPKSEFKRFGLERFGKLVAVLEICGSLGLLVGLWFNPVLIISSAGIATLMLLGLIVRLKIKDGFLLCLPALIYLILNSYIFVRSLQL
jgi:hypothetical protein